MNNHGNRHTPRARVPRRKVNPPGTKLARKAKAHAITVPMKRAK